VENPLLSPPANNAPTAGCTHVVAGATVNFTDTSTDADGYVASWAWDFGDGSGTSTLENPSYEYSVPGTYTVSLVVTDDDSATSTAFELEVEPVVPTTPTDGPDDVFRPETDAHWVELGLPVPTYHYLCQDTSSHLTDVNGDTVLTVQGVPLYQQTVTGWTAKHVGFNANVSSQKWSHPAATGINPNTTSFAMLVYASAEAFSGTRALMSFGAATNGIRMYSTFQLNFLVNSVTHNGVSVGHSDLTDVHPFLIVYNRTASQVRLYTDLEQINGTYASIADGHKGIGMHGESLVASRFNLVAMWSGADAESLSKTTLTTLGWTLAY
jgi:PKD repeat protein